MKYFFLLLLLSMHLSINSGALLKAKKLNRIQTLNNYQAVIDYLKLNEGFSSTIYDDHGYDCIGFGQRIKFYPEKIKDTITIYEAEIILKKSFSNHMKLVKRLYPKEKNNRLLALTHISYTIGAGYLIKHYKNNQIDTISLLKIGKKEIRNFEIKLYYDNK